MSTHLRYGIDYRRNKARLLPVSNLVNPWVSWCYLKESRWEVTYSSRNDNKEAKSPKAHPSTGTACRQLSSLESTFFKQLHWSWSVSQWSLGKEEPSASAQFRGTSAASEWLISQVSSFKTIWVLISFLPRWNVFKLIGKCQTTTNKQTNMWVNK